MNLKKITLISLIAWVMSTASLAYAAERVLIVVTSHDELGEPGTKTGFYLSEMTHPYYVLHDAGYEIDIASVKGGSAPIDPKSLNREDLVNKRYFDDKAAQDKVEHSLPVEDIKYEQYVAVVFSGGHGTMWDFPNNEHIQRLAADIYENNGVVAAVCHGPAALTNVVLSNGKYLVDGKKVSAFTNVEEDLVNLTAVVPFSLEDTLLERGALISKAEAWEVSVSVDERLVTGQNPQSAHELARKVVELLAAR